MDKIAVAEGGKDCAVPEPCRVLASAGSKGFDEATASHKDN